jgi:PAS domain S-box-containing protein
LLCGQGATPVGAVNARRTRAAVKRPRVRAGQPARGLTERLRFEMLVSELSAAFVNVPPGEVDGEIERWLRRIVEFLGIERSTLAQFSDEEGDFQVTHSYTKAGFPPVPPLVPRQALPWLITKQLAGEVVVVPRLEDLPAEAARDKETARQIGVKSNVTIPLKVSDTVVGMMTFTALRRQRSWPEDLVRRFRLVGEVFANALARKRADAVLRESEARFRHMADASPVMVWMSGPVKRCTYFNRRWLEFTGRTLEQELGDGWAEGVHADDLQRCLGTYVQAFHAREKFSMEYRLRRHDGEYRWIWDIGVPRFTPGGRFEGYIGSCTDVTERKRLEEEFLRQRDELTHVARVTTMGEMTASLAHDLNQPLGAILSNAEAAELLLAAEPPAIEEVRAILSDIAKDGRRGAQVIRRMRVLFRKEALELQPQDLNDLIQDVVRLAESEARTRDVTVALDLDPILPSVRGDRIHLQQAVLNLMLNGMEAMTKFPPAERSLVVRTRSAGLQTVEVEVEDRGAGIPEEILPRIFEPFYTTKARGMGMGLSIVRSIVEAHGGRVWAGNNPQGGATVRLALPTDRAGPA